MTEPTERPLLADLRAELAALAAELRRMAAQRWELARLELQADFRSVTRLAIVWSVAAVMLLSSLPVLLVALAEALDGCGHLSHIIWLLILGGGLLILALAGSYLAWRRFRRRFIGLQETLEELREDLAWLQEKAER